MMESDVRTEVERPKGVRARVCSVCQTWSTRTGAKSGRREGPEVDAMPFRDQSRLVAGGFDELLQDKEGDVEMTGTRRCNKTTNFSPALDQPWLRADWRAHQPTHRPIL